MRLTTLSLLSSAALASAQTASTQILGLITDSSGAVLPECHCHRQTRGNRRRPHYHVQRDRQLHLSAGRLGRRTKSPPRPRASRPSFAATFLSSSIRKRASISRCRSASKPRLSRSPLAPSLAQDRRRHARLGGRQQMPVDAYRGAGRPESNYLVERLIDAAARELGIDRDRDPQAQHGAAERHALHHRRSASATTAATSRRARRRRCSKADWAGFAAAQGGGRAARQAARHRPRLLPGGHRRRPDGARRGALRQGRLGGGAGRHPERPARGTRRPMPCSTATSSASRSSASASCRATPTRSRPAAAPAAPAPSTRKARRSCSPPRR